MLFRRFVALTVGVEVAELGSEEINPDAALFPWLDGCSLGDCTLRTETSGCSRGLLRFLFSVRGIGLLWVCIGIPIGLNQGLGIGETSYSMPFGDFIDVELEVLINAKRAGADIGCWNEFGDDCDT